MTFDEWWEKYGYDLAYEEAKIDEQKLLAEQAYETGYSIGYREGRDEGESGYGAFN